MVVVEPAAFRGSEVLRGACQPSPFGNFLAKNKVHSRINKAALFIIVIGFSEGKHPGVSSTVCSAQTTPIGLGPGIRAGIDDSELISSPRQFPCRNQID